VRKNSRGILEEVVGASSDSKTTSAVPHCTIFNFCLSTAFLGPNRGHGQLWVQAV